jgi:LAO/AO transport system kinase
MGDANAELVERALRGDRRSIAKVLSLVERGGEGARVAIEMLHPRTGNAWSIGITGAPGAGKSTLTDQLVARLRATGEEVGVLAVDPTSPFSGGAILGDRVRMQSHTTDPGVFIRSMATRGHLGGLALATPQAVRVLDAVGKAWIVIETVGVGQVEVEIAGHADTTVVVVNPGWGDSVQTAKAGLMEIADVFVVNKADRDGADQVARDLRYMQSLGGRHSDAGAWRPPIVKTSAARNEGIDDLVAALQKHRDWLESHHELAHRRRARAATEIEAIALGEVRQRFAQVHGSAALDAAAARVVDGQTDPYSAAQQLIDSL